MANSVDIFFFLLELPLHAVPTEKKIGALDIALHLTLIARPLVSIGNRRAAIMVTTDTHT